ncbi:Acyl-CoA N-acyltransferase [Pseudocohnilembus persalinus]|uniref:Acyl-CoA N-acyltransferase n=1 Tax=Pseudocohnilembus persalinus TaxID=266149 RepID=A0A0V0QDB0_PSEPJ|nr:Acyl-CoA N-acyltransferase [Pseudocohnilembus persalinus]|eukprot:KRX00195.1 Acyl-CoA N-acyltransferase [Pseudocohnilembus persalinus]
MADNQKLDIQFGEVNLKNYEQLKQLNDVTFPVKYSYGFYGKVLTYQKYSKLAFFNDILIGAMTVRQEERNGEQTAYILTIGVLEAYKRHKVGTQLMEKLLEEVKEDPSIKAIYLHMQVNNESGLAFYKKFGFEINETLTNYYQDIQPADCYILKKKL